MTHFVQFQNKKNQQTKINLQKIQPKFTQFEIKCKTLFIYSMRSTTRLTSPSIYRVPSCAPHICITLYSHFYHIDSKTYQEPPTLNTHVISYSLFSGCFLTMYGWYLCSKSLVFVWLCVFRFSTVKYITFGYLGM